MRTPSRSRLPRRAYTVEETAEALGLSHKTVRELIWRGELRVKRTSDRKDAAGS